MKHPVHTASAIARQLAVAALLVAVAAASWGCSVKKFAVNRLGDALASGGGTYESDEDLELVGDALPFSLKLIDSLLAESPRHVNLRLAACKGFTAYGYAYIQQPAELDAELDLGERDRRLARARRLYVRALGHCLEGLSVEAPGFGDLLRTDPAGAVRRVGAARTPLLYWAAASLGLAISLSIDSAEMLGRLREVDALAARAMELDEAWGHGALHELVLTLDGARPPGTRGDAARLRRHYERALALSGGARASVFLAYAEAAAVRNQDLAEFRSLVGHALTVDPDAAPEYRLSNQLARRRAHWLQTRTPQLFLEAESPAGSGDER